MIPYEFEMDWKFHKMLHLTSYIFRTRISTSRVFPIVTEPLISLKAWHQWIYLMLLHGIYFPI